MLELTSAGQPVQLSPGTNVQLEYHSPAFDEEAIRGTYSYSFTVPARPNGPLYGFPERLDSARPTGSVLPAELALLGLPLLVGAQRVKSASAQAYSVAVTGGLSQVAAQLSDRRLPSFAYGGERTVEPLVPVPGLTNGAGEPVLMPGIVVHANEVAANPQGFDYVFAPLRHDGAFADPVEPTDEDPPPPPQPVVVVNPWADLPAPVLGMPAGGSFVYYMDASDPAAGGSVDLGFSSQPPMCPYPWLRTVLRYLFEEVGLRVDPEALLPGELGDLVLVSNATLLARDSYLGVLTRFSLADVVPDVTVAELLAALRTALGIVVAVELTSGQVRTMYLRELVAAGAAYTDLTHLLVGAAEVSIDEAAGLLLTYQVDSEDRLTQELLDQQPALTTLAPEVETLAELPGTARATANPQPEIRLVRSLALYYQSALSWLPGSPLVTLTWSPLVEQLSPLAVQGGGDEVAQGFCYTAVQETPLLLNAVHSMFLPALGQRSFVPGDPGSPARSTALRLLFYRGLQLDSAGTRYPQLGRSSASGQLSLRLDGPSGTYAQWLEAWLRVKLSGRTVKVPLALSALELSRFELLRPLRLDGVNYLVRKLAVTVPLRKPATLELVRIME